MKILIVDDEKDILEFLSYNLQKEGYEIFRANNGNSALKVAKKEIPDLIILDVMMPEMDGIAATKIIRQSLEKAVLPIIALTANVSMEDREACLNSGMNDFLTKPLNGEALDKTLERWSNE